MDSLNSFLSNPTFQWLIGIYFLTFIVNESFDLKAVTIPEYWVKNHSRNPEPPKRTAAPVLPIVQSYVGLVIAVFTVGLILEMVLNSRIMVAVLGSSLGICLFIYFWKTLKTIGAIAIFIKGLEFGFCMLKKSGMSSEQIIALYFLVAVVTVYSVFTQDDRNEDFELARLRMEFQNRLDDTPEFIAKMENRWGPISDMERMEASYSSDCEAIRKAYRSRLIRWYKGALKVLQKGISH